MAAKASVILTEIRGDLDKAINAFGYAPGMDFPLLSLDNWGEAYKALQVARNYVNELFTEAKLGEEQLGNPRTAEEAIRRWLQESSTREDAQVPA